MDIMLWICQKLVQGSFGVKIASDKKYDIFDTLKISYLTIVVLITCSDTVSPMMSRMCSSPEFKRTTSSEVNLWKGDSRI